MKKNILPNKIYFLTLFFLLFFVSGKFSETSGEIGLDLKFITVYLLLFVIFLYEIIKKNKIYFFEQTKQLQIKFYLFAFSFIVFSIIRAGFIDTYLYSVVLNFCVLFVFIQFLSRVPFKSALMLILIVMFVLLIMNIYYFYISGYSFDLFNIGNREKRLTGVFGGGLAGAIAGLTAIYTVIIYLSSYKKNKIFLLVNFLLSWIVLFLSDNRTSMLACLIIYSLIFLILSNRKVIYKILLLSFVIVGYIFISFYLQSTTRGELVNDDFELRTFLWGLGIEQIKNKPILGFGKINPFSSNSTAMLNFPEMADPHNAYLNFILKNGIIVSLFFFIYLISFFVSYFKSQKSNRNIIFIFIPLYWLVISFTGGDYFNFKLTFSSLIFGISVFGILNHPGIKHDIKWKYIFEVIKRHYGIKKNNKSQYKPSTDKI